MSLSQTNRLLPLWSTVRGRDDESLMRRPEIEATIESIRECAEVLCRILLQCESMVAVTEAGFEISEHHVDPLKRGHAPCLSASNDEGLASAPCDGDCAKAGQPIGTYGAAGRQADFSLVLAGIKAERYYGRDFRSHWARYIVERKGGDDRDFVIRSGSFLAAAAFVVQIGAIDLYLSFKNVALFAHRQGPLQFVLNKPRRRVTRPHLLLPRQCREACLRLTDQLDRQQLNAQRQLRVSENRTGDQRRLVPASVALKERADTAMRATLGAPDTARTVKFVGPPRCSNRLFALRRSTKLCEDFRHRLPRLKLDAIHDHSTVLRFEHVARMAVCSASPREDG